MDIWVVATFLAVRNNAALTIRVQVVRGYMLSFLWDIYLDVELLCHMVILFNLLRNCPNCFTKWLYNFTVISKVRILISPHPYGFSLNQMKHFIWKSF